MILCETRCNSGGMSRAESQEIRFRARLAAIPEVWGQGQKWRFRTILSAISAGGPCRGQNGVPVRDSRQFQRLRGQGENIHSAHDSRRFRQFQRVRGPTTEGVRAGNPGIMILCETLDNSRGSRAATPNRVAALSQNCYGHRRAGKNSPRPGRHSDSWPRIPGQGFLARDVDQMTPRVSRRVKFLADLFSARQNY